jgi:DNA-binding response OmpR family regulator
LGTVLVIDDDEDTLFFMESALGAEGHVVTGAVSAFEAIDFLGQQTVDLIILDLRMPDVTGLELLERIRKEHERVPIVVCSAYPSLADDYAVWSSHVAAVLAKPVAPARLVDTVAEVLGRAGRQAPGAT